MNDHTDELAPLPESHMLIEDYVESPEQAEAAAAVDVLADAEYHEAQDEMQESFVETADAEQMIQVADQVERVVEIAQGIDEATNTEVALVNAAMEMALIGTGLKVTDVFPALESHVGGRISMEAAQNLISSIWAKIVEAFKRMLEKVKVFMQKVAGQLAFLQRRASRVAGKAKSMSGQSIKVADIKLGSNGRTLAVGDKQPKSFGDVDAALRETSRQYDVLMNNYPTMLKEAGNDIAKAMGLIDEGKVEEADAELDKARKTMDMKALGAKFGAVVDFSDQRFESGSATLVKGMPGGWGFVLVDMAKNNGGLQWVRLTDDVKAENETMTTIPAQQCLKLAESCFTMFKTLQGVQFSDLLSSLENLFKRLEQQGKRPIKESPDSEQKTVAADIAKFMTNFTNRCLAPINQFIGHEIEVLRAVLDVCDRSLAAHTTGVPD